MEYTITNERARQHIYSEIEKAALGTKVDLYKDRKYSKKQRGSLHVWCGMIADVLNSAGKYQVVLSPIDRSEIEHPWRLESVKLYIYKPTLEAMTGKTSTEDQASVNPSEVALVINKHFGDIGLVCPDWPSRRG
jgi:hypothetical protein